MKIAISQPRYLAALNYFQRILISDIFVILDSVQHQRRAFEHRNKIKSPSGEGVWCSIPLEKKSSRPIIQNLKVSDINWISNHKQRIKSYYKTAPFFSEELLEEIYQDIDTNDFVSCVMQITINLCKLFKIEYNFILSSSLHIRSSSDQLLYDITKKLNGTEYISGPNGRDYIDTSKFKDINLIYHEFKFPHYNQIHGDFISWMSIIDQIFNIGIHETKKIIFSKPILKDN